MGKARGTTRATPGSGQQDLHLDPGPDIMPPISYRTCLGLLALLVTSSFIPRASPAQFLDPDTKVFCWHCNSHNSHFIGGATADAALHVMPFVKKSWETPAGRIATVAIGGVGLELADYVHCRQTHSCGREGAGVGFVDLGCDGGGAGGTGLR